MCHVQNTLGHSNPKTTELYTKTIKVNNKKNDESTRLFKR